MSIDKENFDIKLGKLNKYYKERKEATNGREQHIGLTKHPGSLSLLVFEIDADIPYFRVENHRIAPQLADKNIKDLSSSRRRSDTQNLIEEILAATPDFKALTDQLEVQGQQEPCIITHDGELVDGNTRCAAIREINKRQNQLNKTPLLIAFLPEEYCTPEIVSDIEYKRQLGNVKPYDYSYTAGLLWTKSSAQAGRDYKFLGQQRGLKRESAMKNRFDMDIECLKYIEEMRVQSGFPYDYFNDYEETLKNLYMALKGATSLGVQNQIKYTRYLAILSNGSVTKDMTRSLGESFLEDLKEKIDESDDPKHDSLKKILDTPKISDDGLGDILPEEDEHFDVDAGYIFQNLSSKDFDPANPDSAYGKLAHATKVEAEQKINRKRLQNMLDSPAETINEMRKNLTSTVEQLEENFDLPNFKVSDIEKEVSKIAEEFFSVWLRIQLKMNDGKNKSHMENIVQNKVQRLNRAAKKQLKAIK